MMFWVAAARIFDIFVKGVDKIARIVISALNAIIDLFPLVSKQIYLVYATNELFGMQKVKSVGSEMPQRPQWLRFKITSIMKR